MNRLIALILLVLLPLPAYAGVVWEENFDGFTEWNLPYLPVASGNPRLCSVEIPDSSFCQASGKPATKDGTGFDRFYAWYMSPSVVDPPTGNGMHIDTRNHRGTSGKGFTVYDMYHDAPSNGGQLAVSIEPGYSELFVRFWMKFQPGYAYAPPGPGMTLIQKLAHISHYKHNGQLTTFFENGGYMPTTIVGLTKENNGNGDLALDFTIRPDSGYWTKQPNGKEKITTYFDIPNDGYTIGNFGGTGTTDFGTPGMIGDGDWHCFEVYLKANTAGISNGVYKFWFDGYLQSSVSNVIYLDSGSALTDHIFDMVHLAGNTQFRTSIPRMEQWRAYDDVVIYTPLTASDPQWATSPQDGRLPLDYTIATTGVYYASPTGSGAADGKTPATAWDIAKVNATDFAAGDTIRFAEGNYGSTVLTPKNSGSAGAPITFAAAIGAATKPILSGVNITGKNHIAVDGLNIQSSGNALLINGGSYNTVTNSTLYSSATAWVNAVALKNGAHFNKITNNAISQASGNNDLVNLRNDCDNNLIEGNTITIENSHAAIDLEGYTVDDGTARVGDYTSNWNIIRGNTVIGHNGGGALINLNANSNYNVVDNNTLKGDSTVASYCNLTSQPALHQDMFKLVGQYNIARNNTLSNYPCKDAMGIEMSPYVYDGFTNNSRYQHVYHNVITGVGAGATPLYLFGYNGGTMADNVIKNNIIHSNGGTYWQPDNTDPLPADTANLQLRDSPSTSYFTNNIIWKSGYNGALVWLGDSYKTVAQADADSSLWDGNRSADPLLDASFLPQTGSPALNNGANLTTVTSASGTGTSFDVADAYYFTDGNGITTGDLVKVGTQTATITEITYGAGLTGTLTVTPAITWTQGMAVNLPFNGTAPSIGLSAAVVAGGGEVTPPPPANATPRIRANFRAHVR